MLFIEWWMVGRFCLSLLILAAAAFLFWIIRCRKPRPHRLLHWLSWPLAVFGVLFLLVNVLTVTFQTRTPPVYSPDGKMAARVRSADEGWLEESSSVELFRDHGLRDAVVFRGGWEAVDASSLHWKSNSELEIHYQETYENGGHNCGRASGLSIRCIPR